jgi:5-formyltetrahydrofolate cyclo-ligase
MMKKQERKNKFRQDCLAYLKKMPTHRKYIIDKKILEEIYELIQENNLKSVMLYLPLEMEVNLYPLIYRLRKEKKNLYVPFMEGKSFRLVKYRLPLKEKKFGIKEPNDSKKFRKKSIDIAIVPIVGLDCTHRRVGFGKGMYDRFFEKNIKNIKQIVFVARELCYSKEVVTDHYDVRADIVLSQQGRQRTKRCWK